jgi:hypothetical protein
LTGGGLRKAGLIVNPRSGKSSGKGLALGDKLRAMAAVPMVVLDRFEALPGELERFATLGVTDLFISSGDGTIQAIQTDLAERRPFAVLPRLILLPHGTTNMTAADLGFRNRSLDAQARFITTLPAAEMVHRPSLRAANPRDGRPRHGMFLGTGAVTEASLYCQRVFNARGVKGDWATFGTLAGAVARTVLSRPNPDDPTRFDRPFDLSLAADGRMITAGTQLLVLATTLEKLILGARPFWGGGTGPIRATALPYPVPNLLRWLLPMMYGGEDRKVPGGAASIRAAVLDIRSPVDFILDGEVFAGPDTGALRIETGPTFAFVRG